MPPPKTNPIAQLRACLQTCFERFYDYETATVLADIHASYHMRFVQQMVMAGSPGRDPGKSPNQAIAMAALPKHVRRPKQVDVLPIGPKTDALMDEIVELVASAGDVSISEIQFMAHAIGSEPDIVRTAVGRLVRTGRIERTQGKDELDSFARYRCTSPITKNSPA